ncbi:MAG: hypothetical protein P4M09_10825 [Devosia sp.]|nr:hypothetical protein [Devosia sp.]
MKFVNGQERLKIDLALGPLGAKQPSAADQSAFISGLENGAGKLKSLNLAFLDADGFPVSDDEAIPVNATWTETSGRSGLAMGFSFLSAGPAAPGKASELSKIDVRWIESGDTAASTAALDAQAAANAARLNRRSATLLGRLAPPASGPSFTFGAAGRILGARLSAAGR